MELLKRYWHRATKKNARTPTIYYVAGDGNDAFDGRHPLQAWRSIERLNNAKNQIKASDQILFKRGYVYTGRPYYLDYKGAQLKIGAYGSGKYPVFRETIKK